MFYNFEPNFNKKFLWENVFLNFGQVTFSRNENSFFGRHFETNHFLTVVFADIWLFWVYTYNIKFGADFVPKFLWKSTENEWLQVDPLPLCTNGSEK